MHFRWVAPLLLALAAPSGFSGSATGGFHIEIQVLAAGDSGPITCSSASSAASVRVNCSTPTFVQISEGQPAQVPGLNCLSYGSRPVPQPGSEGTLYEIRRRECLSTLMAVQMVDPDSLTVELLVTF